MSELVEWTLGVVDQNKNRIVFNDALCGGGQVWAMATSWTNFIMKFQFVMRIVISESGH